MKTINAPSLLFSILIFLSSYAHASAPTDAIDQADNSNLISFNPETGRVERVGDINANSTLKDIERRFGVANVQTEQTETSEGGIITRTTLSAPNYYALIDWTDETATKVWRVVLTDLEAKWSTAEGIKVGTTLQELRKYNEDKEFSFYGFGWDYGGQIVEATGKLEDLNKSIAIFLGTTTDIQDPELQDLFLGDKVKISSDPSKSPRLKEVEVKILGLYIYLRQ